MAINGQDVEEDEGLEEDDCDYVDCGDDVDVEEEEEMKVNECIYSGDSDAAGSRSCLAERVVPRGVVTFR